MWVRNVTFLEYLVHVLKQVSVWAIFTVSTLSQVIAIVKNLVFLFENFCLCNFYNIKLFVENVADFPVFSTRNITSFITLGETVNVIIAIAKRIFVPLNRYRCPNIEPKFFRTRSVKRPYTRLGSEF